VYYKTIEIITFTPCKEYLLYSGSLKINRFGVLMINYQKRRDGERKKMRRSRIGKRGREYLVEA
jgi:hypothetical protein